MTRSGPPVVTTSSNLKEKRTKTKVFHVHGKDSLELAVSIGKAQEDKALLKAGNHHQPQPRSGSVRTQRKSGTKKKLEEIKATIASQRAQQKREKVKMRKERPACAAHQKSGSSCNAQDHLPPRKRVSFT